MTENDGLTGQRKVDENLSVSDPVVGKGTDIFHIVDRNRWQARDIPYVADSVSTEGFMHLSTSDQVLATVQRHFAAADSDALMLIAVDLDAVTSPVRWEAPPTRPHERYPHIYGPLDECAVRYVIDFPSWRKRFDLH